MDIIIITLAAFAAAILTFFSGFGLGTILAPVFAIFFPVEMAVALTGVVHFCNNLFKIVLVGRKTDIIVLIRFGVPAILASFIGAWLLLKIIQLPALLTSHVFRYTHPGLLRLTCMKTFHWLFQPLWPQFPEHSLETNY